MTWWRSRWPVIFLAGLLLAFGLPVLGHWARNGTAAARCDLDGKKIDRAYRVRVRAGSGATLEFCSLTCAEIWLARQVKRPRAIFVTDEISSEEIDARDAFFVRSLVQNPTNGSRIHVFRSADEAARHADQFHGSLLSGSELPFSKNAGSLAKPE